MGLVVYGNRNIEVTRDSKKFIAKDATLGIVAEGNNITEAINLLKKAIGTKKEVKHSV